MVARSIYAAPLLKPTMPTTYRQTRYMGHHKNINCIGNSILINTVCTMQSDKFIHYN